MFIVSGRRYRLRVLLLGLLLVGWLLHTTAFTASDLLLTDTEQTLTAIERYEVAEAETRDLPQYHFVQDGNVFIARNLGHTITATYTDGSVTYSDADGAAFRLQLNAYGAPDALTAVTDGTVVTADNRLEIERGLITEWYVNGAVGVQQGFTLVEKPQAAGDLVEIHMTLETDLTAFVVGGTLNLQREGLLVMTYDGLAAYDAQGIQLSAQMQLEGDTLILSVDTTDAIFPITVDPVTQQAKLVAITPTEQTDGAPDDNFGTEVSLSGANALIGASGANVDDSGAAYVFVQVGNAWAIQAKLTASDGATSDGFGKSVALDGNRAVVGSILDDDMGPESGSVYVFDNVGGNWTQTAKLTADDGGFGDRFGWSVSLDGNRVLIGAFTDDDNDINSGSAYVFDVVGGVWTQTAKLIANDGEFEDRFGGSVSLDGDRALIGAEGDEGGSAYIYDVVGGVWTQTAKLTASDTALQDIFGFSVSLEGDRALVGAHGDDDNGSGSGSAYMFENIGGSWMQTAKLTASDGAPNDEFGYVVSLAGDRALIGAFRDDDNGSDSGSAYVFERVSGSWSQTAKLTANDGVSSDRFGYSASLGEGVALVGAVWDGDNGLRSGSAYVFELNSGSWTQTAKLLAMLPAGQEIGSYADQFGYDVSLSGDTALIGAPTSEFAGTGDEAAYVYTLKGGVWQVEAKLTADDRSPLDDFGRAVALDGDIALIGAHRVDDQANGVDRIDVGAAYVFERVNGVWTQTAKLLADDAAYRDQFGVAVSLDGNRAIVGAHQDNDLGLDSGSAYIFERIGGSWTQTAKLLPDDGSPGDEFGWAVALSGDRALVGHDWDYNNPNGKNGSAYIFERVGGSWTQTAKLTADDGAPDDAFGFAVDLHGNRAVIGAHGDDDNGDRSGSAYVFDYASGSWSQTAKLTADDGSVIDFFGHAVSVNGDVALVSAHLDDGFRGAAYLYIRTGGTWLQVAKLTADDGESGEEFGRSVSLSGNRALIGAGWDDGQGAAYVFDIDISPGDVPNVVRFELWDADQNWNPAGNGKIRDLGPNEIINLAVLQSAGIDNVTVIAVTDPSPTGSLLYHLDGTPYRAENLDPYTLSGDRNGDLRPWRLEAGDTYVIAAVPYTERDQRGLAGPRLETTLTVVDQDPATNQPPTADAGPDETLFLPTTSATLSGSVSDATFTGTLTAQWTVVSGPAGVTFADDTDPTTTVDFPGVGTYVLRLTAYDGAFTHSDDVTIEVEELVAPGEIVLQLWDTETDSLINPNLSLPITINLRQTPNPTLIVVVGGTPTRVDFRLDNRTVRSEETAPYTIAGDQLMTGDLNPWLISPGQYDLEVIAIAGNTELASVQTTLTIIREPSSIVLQLWDTETDTLINPNLSLPITIDLSETPNPTLIAVVDPTGGYQVEFRLDNQTVNIEGRPPYVISGDPVRARNDFNPWTIAPGQYDLEVIVRFTGGDQRVFDRLQTTLMVTD